MTDYSKQYFTTVALSDGIISFCGSISDNKLSFSKDGGNTWSRSKPMYNVKVSQRDKVLWKGTLTPQSNRGVGRFGSTAKFSVEGNIMSLLFGDDFQGKTDLCEKTCAFPLLFSSSQQLVSAENLSLPATILASHCYNQMFSNCTNLTTPPQLPATTLASYCYFQMFYGCTSLTAAPELPAKTLAHYCYYQMFSGCTSLIKTKLLFVEKNDIRHTLEMYDGCDKLKYNPIIVKKAKIYG